jgi:hypothetical protein
MNTDGSKFYEIIGAIYERHKDQSEVSPSWLATAGMMEIGFGRDLHHLGYIGCHLHLRQVSRAFCRKKFDPLESTDDLFPETLQHRYPKKPTDSDEEPKYVLLEGLLEEDVLFNIGRLEKDAHARLKHADAMRAWWRTRRASA